MLSAPWLIRVAQHMSRNLNQQPNGTTLKVSDQEGNIYGHVVCSVANGEDLNYIIEDDDYKSLYPLVDELQNNELCLQRGDKKIICRFVKR
ncbi:MAG: hypothetical protein CO073_02795 [Candidatus Komeilibacteria bacterium CG_4_9_14_0_8_um_filter_36_9]|uniref:Uncharacterized protein n=1 Tax=Candidatus Komeilibacteria bacterium CG_4_9_14_0_8_um_filter_36_9 TaxID=1974473 RepID=A0A2M8DQZ1_9BACT|nr:MAG: hypothetical protein CO073_02795 [Candidatus Komeilibacteria bacterium CG_4_9_14_0_8_um_filter_36_9]